MEAGLFRSVCVKRYNIHITLSSGVYINKQHGMETDTGWAGADYYDVTICMGHVR